MFEQRGTETIRTILPIPGFGMEKPDGTGASVRQLMEPMLAWLKEQYDREERKETWLITMEVAITIFVAVEVLISILDFFFRH